MKNNLKKLLVLLLAANMFAGATLPTFAEEEKTIEGLTPTVSTETTESTDENGNPVITVTITETIGGTDEETGEPVFETNEEGVEVNYEQTTTTTTTTNEDGEVIGVREVVDGSETKKWEEEVKPGQDVPDVEVTLTPGETEEEQPAEGEERVPDATTGSVSEPVTETVTGTDENGHEYTETTTTTTEREVDVYVESELDVTVKETDSDLKAFAPEDYEEKGYDNKDGLLKGMTEIDSGFQKYIEGTPKPEEDGYDYQWTGYGEATNAVRAVSKEIVYKKDPVTGEAMVDEETGEYIIESITYKGKYNDGMDSTPSIFALTKYDEEGNPEYYYGYCIDTDTEAVPGAWYKVSNLEDSDYYPDDESAEKLRAIVNNGYWGQEDGKGSTAQMKEKILAYYGENATITVEDDDGNPVLDENGEPRLFNIAEVLERMNDADALAVTQAAIWSYANGTLGVQDGKDGAIIDGIYSVVKPKSNLANTDRDYDYERDALLKAAYEWLCGVQGEPASSEDVTTIINDKNNVEDMTLVVHDKAETDADGNRIDANYDDDDTNDVYNTDLNFTLEFTPDPETDDLLVHITYTQNGEEITITRRLAGENSEGREAKDITADENGVYTLTGLQLSENSDFTFDLRLEGTQYLKEGVYIYTAHGGTKASQTMVGIASGTKEVEVTASMTLSFEVDETNHVVAEREWHYENDSEIDPEDPTEDPKDPTPTPKTPDPKPEPKKPTPKDPEPKPEEPTKRKFSFKLKIEEEPEIVEIPEEEIPLVNIPDEEIPLTDIPDEPVPMTGDSMFWYISSAAAVLGLCVLNLFGKKKNHNA